MNSHKDGLEDRCNKKICILPLPQAPKSIRYYINKYLESLKPELPTYSYYKRLIKKLYSNNLKNKHYILLKRR